MGEYVSLSKVEACSKRSPMVELHMVYGRTGAKIVVALICPKEVQRQVRRGEVLIYGPGTCGGMCSCWPTGPGNR